MKTKCFCCFDQCKTKFSNDLADKKTAMAF